MKIAYIATSTIPSTMANSIQVMKVCQALTQNGESVQLYVPGTKCTPWSDLKLHYGMKQEFPINWVKILPALKKVDFAISALRKAKSQKVELVYTRLLWAAVFGLVFRFPVILELHDVPTGRFGSWLFRWFIHSQGKKFVVFITSALQHLVEDSYQHHFTIDETVVAPDGVDLERYQDRLSPSEARMKLGLRDTLTAAYSGGFYEGRGLEALFQLSIANPEIQFLWIGGRPEIVSEWKQRLEESGVSNTVLTGFVPNEKLPVYQAAGDILLMPYSKIVAGSSGGNIAGVNSPMKMFEYMAAGRAILTSDTPVLREVLNEGNAAFYIAEDIEDFKLKFTKLLQDKHYREMLSDRALIDVEQYSWRERMKKILHKLDVTK
jgi:glycosyltransferase involved in cell wall biosynthesis